jgi:hypothetical protein
MIRRLHLAALMVVPAAALAAQTPFTAPSSTPAAQPGTITAAEVCGHQTYEQLTSDERNPPPPQIIPLGKSPIALTVSTVEFNDKPVDAKTASSPDFCSWSTIWIGVDVSVTGELSSFADGGGEARGGGGGKLPPEDFARLQQLIDNLPDDHHRVPPAKRRITVEVFRNGGAIVRLYDSADLPAEIIEIIRLTGARIEIVTPVFKPDRILAPDETLGLNLPKPRQTMGPDRTISPDGSIGVLHDYVTKTLTVYQGSAWPQNGGMPQGGEIVRVIPEFWQPDVYGGYWVTGEFSPDARYFLVNWGVGALLFDTTTWQPITDPRIFPQNLKEFLHSPDWSLGVAVSGAGEAFVWDQQAHRVVSKLPGLGALADPPVITDGAGKRVYTEKSGEISCAAFSPDNTRVAIYGGPDTVLKSRLGIWDVDSGKDERDIWTSFPSGQVDPVWWNDGRWLIAPLTSEHSDSGNGLATDIWDAESGRLLGTLDFSGCDARATPVAEGTRLLQGCYAGKDRQDTALEFSVDQVLKQIELFQAMVASESTPTKAQ